MPGTVGRGITLDGLVSSSMDVDEEREGEAWREEGEGQTGHYEASLWAPGRFKLVVRDAKTRHPRLPGYLCTSPGGPGRSGISRGEGLAERNVRSPHASAHALPDVRPCIYNRWKYVARAGQ